MTEKRNALIIACYEYNDADALSQVLKDPVIGGFDVQVLLNKPSYTLRVEIDNFFADRKRDELLLLYFSGHGIKDEDGKLYFATSDTTRKLLRSTAIEANFVNDVMQRSRSRKQVLLLDCCYSGAFVHDRVIDETPGQMPGKWNFGVQGRIVIARNPNPVIKPVELPTNRPVISPEIKKMVFRSQPMRELSKESVESLVLTLAASGGILTTLIGVLQSWLTRHNQRSINLEVNGNKIDVRILHLKTKNV